MLRTFTDWAVLALTIGVWAILLMFGVFTYRSGCQAQFSGGSTGIDLRPTSRELPAPAASVPPAVSTATAPASRETSVTPTVALLSASGTIVHEHRWVGEPIQVRVENLPDPMRVIMESRSGDEAAPSFSPPRATTAPATRAAVPPTRPAQLRGPGIVLDDFRGESIDGRTQPTLRKGGRVDILGPGNRSCTIRVRYLAPNSLPQDAVELYISRENESKNVQYLLFDGD